MGNANSTPARNTEQEVEAAFNRSRSPSIRRYHSITQSAGPSSSSSPRPYEKYAPYRLSQNPSIFGRASSHDGTTSPTESRSRSGSISSFWTQRRGSTIREAQVQPAKPFNKSIPDTNLEVSDYQVTTLTGNSSIETTVRSTGRSRRFTEGIGLPASSHGFDSRNFVSPHPSPSVATQAHYAAGIPSHVATSSSSPLGSTVAAAPILPAPPHLVDTTWVSYTGSEPQQVPASPVYAPHRHPPFGIGNAGIFPNIGTSLSTNAAASPPGVATSPMVSSVPLNQPEFQADAQLWKPPAALPSYLKIPTAIPSTYASASTPPLNVSSLLPSLDDGRPTNVFGGAGAAAVVLNPIDIIIRPGDASRVSSPSDERKMHFGVHMSDRDMDAARAAGIDVSDLPHPSVVEPTNQEADTISTSLENPDSAATARLGNGNSRTPTPTPATYDPRATTPTAEKLQGLPPLSPVSQMPNPIDSHETLLPTRLSRVDISTGSESGTSTPVLPLGLTSAPPSASIPNFNSVETGLIDLPVSPVSNDANVVGDAVKSSSSSRSEARSKSNRGSQNVTPIQTTKPPLLMPIVLTWRAGGKQVFVTGTFANEWRSKILLQRSKRDHTCVLHLPPGTHRLKFIVDDRWRVSRDLPTATDGDGNLVNYVEIPNVGPAHPGPLSAPGEDLAEADGKQSRERPSLIESKRTTMDLIEEARRAHAMRLDDVLGTDDATDADDTWTHEIPASLIAAQEAEEAYREALERGQEEQSPQHRRRRSDSSNGSPPVPPALPRQLEKVILNSSPANPAGGSNGVVSVDDNSILPAPNHVVLNHLTASSIKGGVLAVGTTTRYKRKYVTTVYYRPVQV